MYTRRAFRFCKRSSFLSSLVSSSRFRVSRFTLQVVGLWHYGRSRLRSASERRGQGLADLGGWGAHAPSAARRLRRPAARGESGTTRSAGPEPRPGVNRDLRHGQGLPLSSAAPSRSGPQRGASMASEQSQRRNDQASDGEHPPSEIGAQAGDLRPEFGEPGLELIGRNVIAVVGGQTDRVRDSVRLGRRELSVSQRAGDGVSIEHTTIIARVAAMGNAVAGTRTPCRGRGTHRRTPAIGGWGVYPLAVASRELVQSRTSPSAGGHPCPSS